MKTLKWIVRIILITPFIIGIPTGHLLLNSPLGEHRELTTFENIVAIPGMISCAIIALALIFIIIFSIGTFIVWVFSSDENFLS